MWTFSHLGVVCDSPWLRAWQLRQVEVGLQSGWWGACSKNDKTDAFNTLSPHVKSATGHGDHSSPAGFVHNGQEKKLLCGSRGVPPVDPPLKSW